MTMKKYVTSLALATSMAAIASTGAFAQQDPAATPPGEPALGDTESPTSGPGVQGHPDTRTGPATRDMDGAEGASPGLEGIEGTTQPSQDAGGVEGYPDTRTGPATRDPGDGAEGADAEGAEGAGEGEEGAADDEGTYFSPTDMHTPATPPEK